MGYVLSGEIVHRNNHYYYYYEHISRLARMRFHDTEVDGSNPGNNMLFPCARRFIRIASVESAVK